MSDTRLVGTWITELDDDGTTVPGQVLFTESGGVVSTQVNTKNIGLGTWRSTGADTFAYNFIIMAVNDEGEHVGEARVHVQGTFESDIAWRGLGGADFHSPKGAKLRSHDGSKVTARRTGSVK